MKTIFKISSALLIFLYLSSCEFKSTINSELADIQSEIIIPDPIEQCFTVIDEYGNNVEIILVQESSSTFNISTSFSYEKSTEENAELLIISDSVIIVDRTISFENFDRKYFIFDITLGDGIVNMSAGGSSGESLKLTAECNCMSQSGECEVSTSIINNNVFSAHCDKTLENGCVKGDGILNNCKWTLPTITVVSPQPGFKATSTLSTSTTMIVQADTLILNGVMYY